MPLLVVCQNDPAAFLEVLVDIDGGVECNTDMWTQQVNIVHNLTNNFGGHLNVTDGLRCDYNCKTTPSWYQRVPKQSVFCIFYPVDGINEFKRLVFQF